MPVGLKIDCYQSNLSKCYYTKCVTSCHYFQKCYCYIVTNNDINEKKLRDKPENIKSFECITIAISLNLLITFVHGHYFGKFLNPKKMFFFLYFIFYQANLEKMTKTPNQKDGVCHDINRISKIFKNKLIDCQNNNKLKMSLYITQLYPI